MIHKLLITILLTFVTSSSVLAQGSWLDVQVQTDEYAGETSWEILNEQSEVVAVSPPYQNSTLQNHMVFFVIYQYQLNQYMHM